MECYAWAVEPVVVVVGNISKGMTKRIFPFGSLWFTATLCQGSLAAWRGCIYLQNLSQNLKKKS